MTAMTRVNMQDELKAHGWNRFTDVSLQRYLDWALQTTYGEGPFERSVRDTSTVASQTVDQVSFATIAGASAELLNEVREVMVKRDGVVYPLEYASDDYFRTTIRANLSATTPLTGLPSYYYVHDLNVILYPKPDPAVDVIVDYLRRKDTFSGDTDTTGLPERYDKIVMAWAEVYCHRRARELNEMINMERHARDMMLRELAAEASPAQESFERVSPWGG